MVRLPLVDEVIHWWIGANETHLCQEATMKHFSILTFLALILVSMTLPAGAGVIVYTITQDGWYEPGFPNISSGGEIIGSFSGEDLNNDGVIDLADNEVTSYLVKFVGSIFTPDFTHTLSDLSFFRYTIGSAGFPPSSPLLSSGDGLVYDADDKVIFGPVGCSSPTCVYVEATEQPAFVTRVPEPSSLALITCGLFVWCWAAGRHRGRKEGVV